jgi:hypothetical protein
LPWFFLCFQPPPTLIFPFIPVLANSKDEHFAQAVAKGESATKSYVSADYSPKGAQRPAARML